VLLRLLLRRRQQHTHPRFMTKGLISRAMVRRRVLSSFGVRMVWSFVYLALRRLLELMVLCWRSTDGKEVEILVLRHQRQSCAASTHGLGSSPKTSRCWRRSAVSYPGPDGRSSWSHPRRCFDGTAAWCAGAGPIQRRGAAGHRFPSRCRP
jgi:hypothetical protein